VAETDLSGTVLDGRYKVIEPIAEGAMGSVYRGERLQLGRAVAIKVMHQELPDELASRQRFEREAKLMALLEHPNCVSVIDFGLHDEKPYLVMDLVRGTSLIQLLDEQGHLEVARACDIIRQVLSGLAHAHELGIVHRDIKPANIMISEKAGFGSQVRILDFGLARAMEGSTKLTTGIVVGTPNYMAPEQCKGSDVDARTDLYACGVMLFEMLTGRKPFVASDPIQVVRKHLTEKPPTLASIAPNVDFGDLEAVVGKALAKAPADRFASAVEMAHAVDAAAAKATRFNAAQLFSRAVPETTASPGMQQATMSGWNVPAGAQPGGPTSAPPVAPPAPPVPPDAQASIPLTDSAILPESAVMAPASGTAPIDDAAAAGAATVVSPPPPGALPPLPQAGPYVPPPSFQTGPAPQVPHTPQVPSATTGPAPQVPSATTGPAPQVPSATTGSAPAVSGGSDALSTGAPDRSMTVPPTRPSANAQPRGSAGAADRPIPQLPLTRKQLMIAGGGVLALVVIIAIATSGGGTKQTGSASAGSGSTAAAEETPDDPVPRVVERANALIASEDYEQAVSALRRARKANPNNAELAFLSGKANFGRLWWTDGVADFRNAIELDASYRENPELLKAVLKGFITTPDVDDRIVGFMREIGPPFRPYLEETAETHPKKHIRARARAELNARP